MNPELERRYRVLLRTYPAAYRRDHEQEILTTLGESSRLGQCWPNPREASALVAAGIRARAMAAGDGSSSGLVRDGLHLGTTLLVAANAVTILLAFVDVGVGGSADAVGVCLAWMVAFATLVVGGRWLPVLAVAIAAAATIAAEHDILLAQPLQWFDWSRIASTTLLPLLLVAGLAARRPLPGRSPLLLLVPVLPYAVLMMVIPSPFFISSTLFGMLVVVTVFSLAVAPFDPRPAIAVALFLVPTIALLAATAAQGFLLFWESSWLWTSVWTLAAAMLAVGGLAGSRRVARA